MHRFIPVVTLVACATPPTTRFAPLEQPPVDATESFYSAHVPRALRSFNDSVQKSYPDSARAHELAATVAQLDGNEDLAFEELMAALADTNDDAALLHVHLLGGQAWTQAHRKPVLGLMRSLA